MDIPERGTVLICSAIGLEFQLYSLKKLVGSTILVHSIDGPSIECEVIDVSLSFSITERPIVGINIRGKLNLNGIKRGSFIQKL
ncbi:hypothetical protein C0Q44_00105 [Paenibacillus sp. PCH8]|uniref:hypothetical protein n=1 Tax=Paenibacillus sp. PCH8 TaxID=2066524 RepID=UPI000CF99F99|nr:hypothetical protein [Paenibacillus sp. PCH8]PQP83179.1 hypothetical protein C0Q44_00105 [Paenibacillus sp. PCH8]